MAPKILVTGALGQVGTDLYPALQERYGKDNVVCTYHRTEPTAVQREEVQWEQVNVLDKDAVREILTKHKIDTVYHLAGVLSAKGEENPTISKKVNFDSAYQMLELAEELNIDRMFWPSSIAAFGPNAPRENTPQDAPTNPTTSYGAAKVAMEAHCNYFAYRGVDIRSLRFPGLISWKAPPGGGTTDYAVAVFHEAIKNKHYDFFVREDTVLPMMYMDDAIKGTIDLMEADPEKLTVRTSYNHTALSFSAKELAEAVKKRIPDFTFDFKPDHRQKIADSWPATIDDSKAREDWGWTPAFDLDAMVDDMLLHLKDQE